MRFFKSLTMATLCLIAASSLAQVMTPPSLVLVGGENTPFGRLSSTLVRVLPNSPGLNGRSQLNIGGVTEYYHLSNLAPLSKIFSRNQIPLRTGESLGTLQPDFEGHSSSPGDQPNPADFVFRVSSTFNGISADSLARFQNGAVRYVARHGTMLNGKVVATVRNVRPSAAGDAVFTVTVVGGGERLYLFRKATFSLTLLTQSEKTMPDGRVLGLSPLFEASVDDAAQRVFFRVSEAPLLDSVYSCKFDGSDLRLVATSASLVPGSVKNISRLIHAFNNRAILEAGDVGTERTLFSVQNQAAQPLIGVGMPLNLVPSSAITTFQALASSANGLWQSCLVNLSGPGQGQLVVRGPNPTPTFSDIWLGPTSGTTYTDAATGRQFLLEGFVGTGNVSNSGDVQFLARVKLLDTGITSVSILRTHPNLF